MVRFVSSVGGTTGSQHALQIATSWQAGLHWQISGHGVLGLRELRVYDSSDNSNHNTGTNSRNYSISGLSREHGTWKQLFEV